MSFAEIARRFVGAVPKDALPARSPDRTSAGYMGLPYESSGDLCVGFVGCQVF